MDLSDRLLEYEKGDRIFKPHYLILIKKQGYLTIELNPSSPYH